MLWSDKMKKCVIAICLLLNFCFAIVFYNSNNDEIIQVDFFNQEKEINFKIYKQNRLIKDAKAKMPFNEVLGIEYGSDEKGNLFEADEYVYETKTCYISFRIESDDKSAMSIGVSDNCKELNELNSRYFERK